MNLRDEMRSKEDIFKSDYITVAELSLFKSIDDCRRQWEKAKKEDKNNFVSSRYEILDL